MCAVYVCLHDMSNQTHGPAEDEEEEEEDEKRPLSRGEGEDDGREGLAVAVVEASCLACASRCARAATSSAVTTSIWG